MYGMIAYRYVYVVFMYITRMSLLEYSTFCVVFLEKISLMNDPDPHALSHSFKGCNLIRNTRRDMYGDDKFRAIELKYGSGSKSENFLMFSIFWSNEDGPQQILGFSLYSLVKLLKYKKLFLHVDATFDGAPRGFYQVVIFSVIDHASSLHTPIFFVQ